MSVPAGLSPSSGMPIGVQLIASHFAEEQMFRAAAAYETAIGFDTSPPTR